jgi:hypothetical protein
MAPNLDISVIIAEATPRMGKDTGSFFVLEVDDVSALYICNIHREIQKYRDPQTFVGGS